MTVPPISVTTIDTVAVATDNVAISPKLLQCLCTTTDEYVACAEEHEDCEEPGVEIPHILPHTPDGYTWGAAVVCIVTHRSGRERPLFLHPRS